METGYSRGTLIILNGVNPVYEVNLDAFGKQVITFGRDAANDITILSGIVSKTHGYFDCLGDSIGICDNNSTNGIIINDVLYGAIAGDTVKKHILHDGDIIRIDAADGSRAESKGVIMIYTRQRNKGIWKSYPVAPGNNVFIGRDKDNQISLQSLQISRRHAVVSVQGGNTFIFDNNSANGTFVNGERVIKVAKLNERDVIYIANTLLLYANGVLLYKSEVSGTRVVMQGVSRVVRAKHGSKTILNNANIQIEPNEFVAIIGGSGSGKTTIMNAMSGYEKANSGKVFVNSVDLYKHYKVLKNIIGYVPQQDIIYENLSLNRMLKYSARLRMPDDVSVQEIDKRISEVLEMVGLTEHKDKLIKSLSGGQKKRASIAVELLGDPGLFFLDEPTSGLDPGTEESLMKSLRNLAKHNNKTVIMVTHTTQNLHLCDKIILMGVNGNICFYGTVPECLARFGVNNLTEVYNIISDPAKVGVLASAYLRSTMTKPGILNSSGGEVPKQKKEKFSKQFKILSSRYIKLIASDAMRLFILFVAQPIGIGLLISLVANEDVFEGYSMTKSVLFSLACACIWMGLFNSIQEICKERTILKREYMANLRLDAYVLSKFAVQTLIAVVQAALLTIVFTITVGTPQGVFEIMPPVLELFITLSLTIIASAGVGLIVSSISKNSDKALTVAPFLLIFQLLFSGILFELSGFTQTIANFTMSKWSVAALGISSDMNALAESSAIPIDINDLFEFNRANISGKWGVLCLFVIVGVFAAMLLLRNVSKDSR